MEHMLIQPYINKLRKELNIPEDWKSYKISMSTWSLIEDIAEVELVSLGANWNGTDDVFFFGKVQKDYFTAISVPLVHDPDQWPQYVIFLFTADLKRFKEEYEEKAPDFEKGVYIARRKGLQKYDLGNVEEPILNEQLQDKIIKSVKRFIELEQEYSERGFQYKRGILLYGPPGNGKTTLIRKICKELDAVCLLFDTEQNLDFLEDVRDHHRLKNRLKVIIFEDIDRLEKYNRSKVLNYIDGIIPMHNTIFIATTNFPDMVDVALDRPSRFDSMHKVGKPNDKSRKILLERYFDLPSQEIEELVGSTKGFSASHIKELHILSFTNDKHPRDIAKILKTREKDLKEYMKTYVR